MYLLQLTERSRICSAGISIDSAMETCSMYPMYLSTNTLGTDTPCLHKTTKVMPTFAYPTMQGTVICYPLEWHVFALWFYCNTNKVHLIFFRLQIERSKTSNWIKSRTSLINRNISILIKIFGTIIDIIFFNIT